MTLALSLLQPKARVGLLVPSANPSVEPELRFLLPETVGIHVARFPVMPGTTLDERNAAYIGLYEETQKGFGALKLQASLVGLTGPSYRLLPEGDLQLCEELSAKAGLPMATASVAILQALAALRAKKIALVSPYPAWLTDIAAAYWQALGCEVVQIVKISEEFKAYELTSDEVAAALDRVNEAEVEAVVMSGTGMLSVPASLRAAQKTELPFLSSNLCSAWWLLKTLGLEAGDNLKAAAPMLSATLRA